MEVMINRFKENEASQRFQNIYSKIREFKKTYNCHEGRSNPGYAYIHNDVAAFYCPHCGSNVYGAWHHGPNSSAFPNIIISHDYVDSYDKEKKKIEEIYNNLYREVYKELTEDILSVINTRVCPLCGKELSTETGYFGAKISSGYDFKFEDEIHAFIEAHKLECFYGGKDYIPKVFDELKTKRNLANQTKADQLLAGKQSMYDIIVLEVSSEKIEKTRDSFKKYVKNLLDLELNIFSLSKRLNELYVKEMQCKEQLNQSKLELPSKEKPESDLAVAQENHRKLSEEYDAMKAVKVDPVPVSFPKRPGKPNYIKEGLFNKKKAQAENEALKKQHEEELKLYEVEYAKAKDLQEKLTLEKKQKHDEEVNKLSYKLMDAYDEVKKAQKVLDSLVVIEKEPDELISKAYSMIAEEINGAENLLEKLYKCRNEMYAYDLVFLKYRNPVALASFYEYLSAGRCDSLEGPNGAYNIFETDCKANLIISKLSKVVETLEEIKDNQYMIYSKLNEINGQLGNLNSSMDKAVNSLTNIKDGVARIADNSDVIAYNTQVTAYYSKVNAELTNSLGYMVAFS